MDQAFIGIEEILKKMEEQAILMKSQEVIDPNNYTRSARMKKAGRNGVMLMYSVMEESFEKNKFGWIALAQSSEGLKVLSIHHKSQKKMNNVDSMQFKNDVQ